MTTPTVTEIRRNGNPVGERTELARYTIPSGERVLHGQRVDGVVRFLPGERVVLGAATERRSGAAYSSDQVSRSAQYCSASASIFASRV
jgi:hypothetical protein